MTKQVKKKTKIRAAKGPKGGRVVENSSKEQTNLTEASDFSVATKSNGSIEAQVAHLGDSRLSTVQRQDLARQIGDKQGNSRMSRVINLLQQQHSSVQWPEAVQRDIAIGGTDLDDAGLTRTQDEIVRTHLTDIVENSSGDFLFTNAYRENLIRQTVRDMYQASAPFQYSSVEALARDVRQRVLVSLYMRQSQGRTRRHKGFSYPDRASDGTAGVEARVNEAAQPYWGPRLGDYHFELSPAGRNNAYEAIVSLFTEQTNPHLRTLIHCDYLVSVIQYRAWAESIGPTAFNAAVRLGFVNPILKWNGFDDLEHPNIVPMSTPPFFRIEAAHQTVEVASEDDLVVGDHVVFYNHESYDALIEGVGGIWRLENAIVIDKRGGEIRYQGHGYFTPVPKSRLLAGMIRQYNQHVQAAQRLARRVERARTPTQRTAALDRLHDDYPNVHPAPGGGWEIRGEGFCETVGTWELRPLTEAEAPGLIHPCDGVMRATRPVHTTS